MLIIEKTSNDKFLDLVRDWLKASDDPRLVKTVDGHDQINDLPGACADFCAFMARKATDGSEAGE